MCGIYGITSSRDVAQQVVEGLQKLEYRGYDSCGVVVLDQEGLLSLRKGAGEVAVVRREEHFEELSGSTALGHTRWATHGRVSRVNAHPHLDSYGDIAIVHNGILENHAELRSELEAAGHAFLSETDSEVVAHLIEEGRRAGAEFEDAVVRALRRLKGTFGIGVLSNHAPGTLYAARNESPLLLGIGEGFQCFASDPLAFAEQTQKAVVLEDGELAVVTPDTVRIVRIADQKPVEREPIKLDIDPRDGGHAGFTDFMSKEISENGVVTRVALALPVQDLDQVVNAIEEHDTTFLTGIGTSFYVAVMGQYLFQKLTGRFLPALSSDELPYLASFKKGHHIVAISQSGETYDTLKALRAANAAGAKTSAILNVSSSSMAREVDHTLVQGAGAEICVLSTKATISQLVILIRVALRLGERSGFLSKEEVADYREEMTRLPALLDESWKRNHEPLRDLARGMSVIRNWFFLGRAVYHGLALEAALKFKEVTYCHAEGLPAGALKHGTISLIDESMHSAIFLPHSDQEALWSASLGAVAEIQARGGTVIAFLPEGSNYREDTFHTAIEHPRGGPLTDPLLALMQAQMFAYYTARALGRNVDKPRNLAKSVTVG